MSRYFCYLTLFCATSVLAQIGKMPWQWNDDERLTARFDAQAIAARNAAYMKSRSRATTLEHPVGQGLRYVIDGRRNPELFLRHELLDHLLRGLGSNERANQQYREPLTPFLVAAGLNPGSFWTELSHVGQPYLALAQRIDAQHRGRTGAEEKAICAARVDMLAAAEKRFGRERFDRFLYTAIAPSIIHTESTTYPDALGRLRQEAGGCK